MEPTQEQLKMTNDVLNQSGPPEKGNPEGKAPDIDPNLEGGDGDDAGKKSEPEGIQKEFENHKLATQKRINKLVAQNKSLMEQVSKKEPKIDFEREYDDNVDAIKNEFDALNSKWSELENDKYNARQEGEEEKVSAINKQMKKIDIKMKRLDDEFMKLESGREDRINQSKQGERLTQFSNSFASMFDQFPELEDENGGIDQSSDLYKAAVKLMETNARAPKWAKFAKGINPKYDNQYGPQLAVLEAATQLSKKEAKTNKTIAQNAMNSNDLRNQPLSGGRGQHIASKDDVNNKTIDQLIANVSGTNRVNKMMNTAKALKAIKKKNGWGVQ